MQPHGRIWQELTWSWAYSTGHPTSDQRLEAAAKAAWPYALLCAWTYLNDHAAAHDLMDHAVQNTFDYLGRHTDCPDKKLAWRIKGASSSVARGNNPRRRVEKFNTGLCLIWKKCMLVNQKQSKESMRTNCSRGFRRLPNRSWSCDGWDTRGGRSLNTSTWTILL